MRPILCDEFGRKRREMAVARDGPASRRRVRAESDHPSPLAESRPEVDSKSAKSKSVLDGIGNLTDIKLRSGIA